MHHEAIVSPGFVYVNFKKPLKPSRQQMAPLGTGLMRSVEKSTYKREQFVQTSLV